MEENLFSHIRKHLHQHPERSGQERQTAAYITRMLSDFSPTQIHTHVGGHGIIAEYFFSEEGPTLLFRADMDAVAIQENGQLPHQSVNPGIAHKCGHDGHTTILLAFAALLNSHPFPQGRILLLFQPSEENGKGAEAILKDPCLSRYPICKAFALHNLPGYPLASVVCRTGSFSCSVISCVIRMTGKTSHAAEPEKAVSPLPALLNILHETESWNQQALTSPDYFRSSLIELHIGEEAYGVTAGQGLLRLTLRAASEKKLKEQIKRLENLVSRQTLHYPGLTSDIEWLEAFRASENDPVAVQTIRCATAQKKLTYLEKECPFAWGEDFGLILQQFSGALLGLGAGDKCAPLHSPEYDFPDEIIETGASLFYEIARETMGN